MAIKQWLMTLATFTAFVRFIGWQAINTVAVRTNKMDGMAHEFGNVATRGLFQAEFTIQIAAGIQRIQIITAAHMEITDENLRHAA